MGKNSDSYVVITLKHEFDLVYEDEEGNYLPLDPVNLPDGAYMYRGMISEAHFPRTRTIGEDCFRMCMSLKVVDMPVLERIGDNAFEGCEALETLNMPLLQKIGNGVFKGCGKINFTDIGNLRTVGESAFEECSDITQLDMPICREICDNAFRSCIKISSAKLPMLSTLGCGAFAGCTQLREIVLPNLIKLETLLDNPPEGDDGPVGAFHNCSAMQTAILPLVTKIHSATFRGCSGMKCISIPYAVAGGIPNGTFAPCYNMEWINLAGTVKSTEMEPIPSVATPNVNQIGYKQGVGVRPECNVICRTAPDMKTTILYGKKDELGNKNGRADYKPGQEYEPYGTAPNTKMRLKTVSSISGMYVDAYADKIGDAVFQNKTQLESAFFPELTDGIGENAFKGCSRLKWVMLPRLDNPSAIAQTAFSGCTSVEYVELVNATTAAVESSLTDKGNWGLPSGCVIVCGDGMKIVE